MCSALVNIILISVISILIIMTRRFNTSKGLPGKNTLSGLASH